MRVRILLVVLFLFLVAGFAAINWSTFMAPTELSLMLTTVNAPVGLVMLAILVLVVLAFAVYMAVWQSATLLDSRRHAKELQAQRALAESAETSRFTELRRLMSDELERMGDQITQTQDALRTEIRDNSNSLAATVAEFDDRLQKLCKSDTP